MIFRVGMPFAQVADGSLTRRPSRQGNGFVSKRHPLEQVTKPLVPSRGNRRLLYEQVASMYGTKQKPASFAVGIAALNMLTECLQRTCRKMQQPAFVAGRPGTQELHMGQSRSCRGSQSDVAS